jgi:hypothetical protein
MAIAFMKIISWLYSFWWHKLFGHRLVHGPFVSMDYGLWFRAVWNYMHTNNVGVLVQCLWQLHPISRWASATMHQILRTLSQLWDERTTQITGWGLVPFVIPVQYWWTYGSCNSWSCCFNNVHSPSIQRQTLKECICSVQTSTLIFS